MKTRPHLKFALLMAISFVTMCAAMFLNVYKCDQMMLGLIRTYVALLMMVPMAITMLLAMWSMYKNKPGNYPILIGAVVVFVGVLRRLRTQTPITDVQSMKAMIPHHSSAILVSQNAP